MIRTCLRALPVMLILVFGQATGSFAQPGNLVQIFQKPIPAENGLFGVSIAVAVDNILVGASRDSAVYLFDSGTGDTLLAVQKPDPTADDGFGASVAVAGNNLLVGAPGDTSTPGSAYVFNGATGEQLLTVQAPAPSAGDGFGSSVASVGENVLIGAPFDDTGAVDAGAAYLFDGATGALIQAFQAPAPAEDDGFGSSVASVGGNVLIGAPFDDTGAVDAGAAYLFNSATGALVRTFQKGIPSAGDGFGSSVTSVGENVLIGAPFDDTGGPDVGAAYLFDGAGGGLIQFFPNPTPTQNDGFGSSVASVSENVLIGAPFDDTGAVDAGAAYLFDGASGGLIQFFPNPTPAQNDGFGSSVASVGENVLIGAPFDSTDAVFDTTGVPNAGTVYLFETTPVSLAKTTGFKGSKTPVSVSLKDASRLVAGTFKVSYDQNTLRVETTDASTTDLTKDFIIITDVDQGQGRLAITIASGAGLPVGSSGALVDINFQIKDTTTVSVGDTLRLDLAEATLVQGNGGLVTTTPEAEDGSLEVLLRGDMNGNEVLDLQDLVVILRIAFNLVPFPTASQLALADVDENRLVDLNDALFVIRNLTRATKRIARSPGEEPISITLSPVQASAGARVSIPVQADAASLIYGMDLGFSYDPEALFLEGIVYPETGGVMVHNTQTPGVIRLGGVSQDGFGAKHLAELRFVAQQDGLQWVRLELAHLLGANGEALAVHLPDETVDLPERFRLYQNTPNPFNPTTVVRYDLPELTEVRITVYNVVGQHVETLLHRPQAAGQHQVVWDGAGVSSGLYLFVIEAGEIHETMKMVLLK